MVLEEREELYERYKYAEYCTVSAVHVYHCLLTPQPQPYYSTTTVLLTSHPTAT